jgi:hypothetical protein
MQPHSCNGPNSMPPQKQIKKEEPNPKPKPVPIVEGQQTLRSVSEPSGSWQELMIQLLREIRFELQTSREFLEILSRDSTYNKTSEELIAAAKALEESEKAKQKQKQRQNEVPASNVQLHSTRQVPDTSRSTRVRTEEYSTAEEEPSDEDRERYNSYGPDR